MTLQAQTPRQLALLHKLQQALHANESIIWSSYPDIAKRAKSASVRTMPHLFLVLIVLIVLTSILSQSLDSFLLLSYGAIFFVAVFFRAAIVFFRQRTMNKRLQRTIYAITNQRLIVMTQDRGQVVFNSYAPSDLGRIDSIERDDGWGDIIIGQQHLQQSGGFLLAVVAPRLSGIANVGEVATLLEQRKHLVAKEEGEP